MAQRTPSERASCEQLDQAVYDALSRYCFGEAICWPSQALIASDLGIHRSTVNRAIRRLIDAGRIVILEKRWSPRARWSHNVYELADGVRQTSRGIANRIVARSRYRGWKQRYAADYERLHTNRRFYKPEPPLKHERQSRTRLRRWVPGMMPGLSPPMLT